MNQILNKLRDTDPNDSDAIKEALSPFFQQLPKHSEVNCTQWLKALEGAINRFPKYCMSQRGNIETYLTYFLDSTNYYIVIEAAKCAHALQQVRPTQEKTATAKTSWRDQMTALCDAAHMLLGAIFPNAVDIYQQAKKIQKEHQSTSPLATALSQLSAITAKMQGNKAFNKQALLCTRLKNVFVFIQAMLVEIYPVAKPVRPQIILSVIVRALSVSSGNNTNQNLSDMVSIKTEALRSLDALVVCLGPNLIPFSPLVFRFVMQTLKWCSDYPSEQSSKVRCSAYSSLKLWLRTLHTHRVSQDRGKCWEDELTDHIIADITPYKHVVQLQMSSQPTKHLSKKAKRKYANSMLQDSNISSYMPGEKNKVSIPAESNEEVAIAALECAETFFIVCGIFLSSTTHKRFQERLVRECYALQSYSARRSLKLLRALEASRKAGSSNTPPPTQHCLQLFSVHVNSPHTEISSFCSQALLDIRMHLHCAPPSLNFALEEQSDAQIRREKKKQISEKNRAALEALLGADKIPRQAEKEEIIAIADEPSNKKRKVDDSDQISVSSEGGIEISDESDGEISSVHQVQVVIENVDNNHVLPNTEVDIHKDQSEIEIHVQKEPATEEEIVKTIDITEENDIHVQETQFPNLNNVTSEDKVDLTHPDAPTCVKDSEIPSHVSVYEAVTQLPPNVALPLNVSNDDDDETPLSMEIVYDYPNTGKEKVTVLEKLDGDNLPSTNETDDIQITCGQILKNSQELDSESKKVNAKNNEVKVNGTECPEKPIQNGAVTESTASNGANKELNVDDMLADFVDEVNDDTQQTQIVTQA